MLGGWEVNITYASFIPTVFEGRVFICLMLSMMEHIRMVSLIALHDLDYCCMLSERDTPSIKTGPSWNH